MVTRDEARRELARRELERRRANMSSEQLEARQNLASIAPSNQPQQSPFSILPLSRDEKGSLQFDANAGLLGSVLGAFTAPGRAMSGDLQVMGPDGHVTPEAIAEGFNFAGTFSPMNPGVRAGDNIIPGEARNLAQAGVQVPTQQMLRDEAAANFKAMRGTGVDYSSDAVKQMAQATKMRLEEEGFDAEVAGRTHKILDRLSSPPEGSVANIKGLHSARKTFGKIAQNFNEPSDQSAASQAIQGLDDFISSADPSSVVAGSASDAANLLRTGNANFAASKRAETLTDLMDAAQLRANAANSGANGGNTTRQRVASLLLNDKASSGFSSEEIAALRGVNEGSMAANATRRAGNMLGGGGGIGASMIGLGGAAAGAMTGDAGITAAGASLPLAGAISREVSNYLTESALRNAESLVRQRSPLYQSLVENAPMIAQQPTYSPAVIRALILAQQQRDAQ